MRRARVVGAARVAGLPAWVVLTQLFIGLGWLRAVAEKIIDPQWWSGEVISNFTRANQEATLGWYQPFVESVVVPYSALIALVVVAGQLVAGLSLTTGRRLGLGIAVAMFLNMNFLAAGAVAPSAFYLLAQGSIALWMAERSRSRRSVRRLRLVALLSGVLGIVSLPFISTLHPHEVIDDPAIMLAFGGALATLACILASNTLAPAEEPKTPGGAFSAEVRVPELVQ